LSLTAGVTLKLNYLLIIVCHKTI